jgi:hypothetical protein
MSLNCEGSVKAVKHKAGEVVWEAPSTQERENTVETPLELLLFELMF